MCIRDRLGGRALIADSFSRALNQKCELQPGNGHYGHREGYNVLYGDWHAKWYGDPNAQIMYWPVLDPWGNATDTSGGYGGLQKCGLSDVEYDLQYTGAVYPAYTDGYRGYVQKGPIHVWHLLDVDAGIDVGTEEHEPW